MSLCMCEGKRCTGNLFILNFAMNIKLLLKDKVFNKKSLFEKYILDIHRWSYIAIFKFYIKLKSILNRQCYFYWEDSRSELITSIIPNISSQIRKELHIQ